MRRVRHLVWPWVMGLCVLGGVLVWWQSAAAQQRIIIQPRRVNIGGYDPAPETAPAFITNREMSRRLRMAEELFENDKDYRSGVRYVQSILDEKEDWFLERPRQAAAGPMPNPRAENERQFHFSSLKHEAEELIASLPEAGRDVYEQESGTEAGLMLKQAIPTNDEAKLSEIARRYFHTKAGYEAVYRLGVMKADHGEPFAAALHLERLKALPDVAKRFEPLLSLKLALCWDQAGLPKQSLAALRHLKRNAPQSKIRLGRQEIPLFDRDDEAAAWLAKTFGEGGSNAAATAEQWTVFRGNPSRNAASSTASPVGPLAWSHNTLREEEPFGPTPEQMAKLEKELDKLAEEHREDKHLLPIPVAQPLIVNHMAIFRTLRNIQAIDLRSGETLWKTMQTDEMLRPVLTHTAGQAQLQGGNPFNPGGFGGNNSSKRHFAPETYLTQRKWRDMTWGALSCDSQRVYAVEEVGLADGRYFALPSPNDPFEPQTYNKLIAFGLQDGFAEWEAGGPLISQEDPLGGTFFLGPPLPLGEQLFCLGERKNEISLMVLDAATGKLVWEQRLVSPALTLTNNRERRVMGLSPTFGHGVMICPTASGAVVAVDISRRMLLWAYQYESSMTEDTMVTNMAWQRGPNVEFSQESIHPEDRWADTVPVVVEGKVLITPSDSYELHCLDLSTGELQWTMPREQEIFLAGVQDGLAIVVGRSQVRALSLTDGRDAWTRPVSIPLPAGRGFFSEGRYHLPLSTGEMATLDLKQGRMVARSKFPNDQKVGNLVSAGGRVVFQSLDTVGAFQPWNQLNAEIQQKLKADPKDAEALALRGQLRLHQGDEVQALADLQDSYAAKPSEETRSLIVNLLLDGLRKNPEQYQNQREQLRPLLRTSQENLQYLMLTASTAKSANARADAFRDYLRLARTLGSDLELYELKESHRARSDRWVKARLEDLAAAAAPEELKDWDRIVAEEFVGQLKNLPAESRLRILSCLPRLPAVEAAEWAILSENGKVRNTLQNAFLLKQLSQAEDGKLQEQARLALAQVYLELWRMEEAYPVIKELGPNWPDNWREQFKELEPSTVSWPNQKLEATFHQRRVAVLPEVPVEVEKVHNSSYANWTFSIDQQSRRLLARNENGQERWHWDLGESTAPILDFEDVTIAIHGHLAVVKFQAHFVVLDLLKREHTATMLWWKLLVDEGLGVDELLRLQEMRQAEIFGGALPLFGDHFGSVLLIDENTLLYQVGERLMAADPFTGKTLWSRDDLRPRCRLFGNGQHVVVVAPDGSAAFVLRTTDGDMVRLLKLPEVPQQVAFDGIHLMQITGKDLERVLERRNLLTDKIEWKTPCPEGSELQRIGREELALLQPDGTFRILSRETGEAKVETKIEPDEKRKSFQVYALAPCYVLLTNRSEQPLVVEQNRFLGESTAISVNGPVYAFDRTSGKQLWKTEIEDQALERLPPHNSPVLVFNKKRLPGQLIGGFGQNNYLVRILDLRNGEIIYKHNRLQHASPWNIRIQPTRQLLTITFYESVIEVELTKTPLSSS